MQRAVGPFQIIERQNRFLVRKDRALISTHRNYLEAEDAALRLWLDQDPEDSETHHEP